MTDVDRSTLDIGRTSMTSEVKCSQHASQAAEHVARSQQHVFMLLGSFCKPENSYKVHMWTVHKPWLQSMFCSFSIGVKLRSIRYCLACVIYMRMTFTVGPPISQQVRWNVTRVLLLMSANIGVVGWQSESPIQWQRPNNLCGAPHSHSLWMLNKFLAAQLYD